MFAFHLILHWLNIFLLIFCFWTSFNKVGFDLVLSKFLDPLFLVVFSLFSATAFGAFTFSALGKRNKEDHKITDLLYLTAAHLKYNVDAMSVFEIVKNRYYEVKKELELDVDLDEEFDFN